MLAGDDGLLINHPSVYAYHKKLCKDWDDNRRFQSGLGLCRGISRRSLASFRCNKLPDRKSEQPVRPFYPLFIAMFPYRRCQRSFTQAVADAFLYSCSSPAPPGRAAGGIPPR